MRHVSVFTSKGKMDMEVSEETNLRDKENNYNKPIFNNKVSFNDLYDDMLGVAVEELKKRKDEVVEKMSKIEEKQGKFKPLKFGTSGLRSLVTEMTDMECYINARGFIKFLKEREEIDPNDNNPIIAIAGDLRSSTPRIMKAVIRAIEDEECTAHSCGFVPSPVLAYYSIEKGIPSVMVTGSHIPDDRNGIKFTKKTGEVLKSDEADILSNVSKARDEEYIKSYEESLFDENGMFKTEEKLIDADFNESAVDNYKKRYLEVFSDKPLEGMKIVLYQHSAVGRDIVKELFEKLGAEVIAEGRSDSFVPVDTEKVSKETLALLTKWASKHKPFALISTDGDSDRPLFADENGKFLPGDKLGALVSMFLEPEFAAIPISANDAIVSALTEKGIQVEQTKIGSPYVIKAMNDKLNEKFDTKAVGWESNGGFLLGSKWNIAGEILEALPTRDAVLPILSVLLLAKKENLSASALIESKLPERYTHADTVDDKTKGCEKYTTDMGQEIIKMFSPSDDNIKEINSSSSEFNAIKEKLSKYFNKDNGFDEVVSVNFVDGIRVAFDNGDVAHMRPSGNAPEFRMYATADTQERANEIVGQRIRIISKIVEDLNK